MNKPLIGITSYSRNEENRFTLPAKYIESIERAQGIPVLITPVTERSEELIGRLDGFILTGGADVDPATYGGENDPTVYGVNPERDQFELALARAVAENAVPLLAICRGIQVLNVAMGGTLVEHIPNVYGESVIHRDERFDKVEHIVSIFPESRLTEIMGVTEFNCPSFHHQCVRDIAPEFIICSQSEDGVVEAIESAKYPKIIAVQWHPEYISESDASQQRLFDTLVRWSAH